MEHLSRVLCYNNYPQWLINKWGKSDKHNPIIHPETGVEIQKCFYISVPYYPGLSESYKKIFKYTPIRVCFKGVNTLRSLLMHPKDKISTNQKKDIVYHWECQADGCNSSYIGKPPGLLVKGSRNTPNQQPQPYLNTVKISTTRYPPSPILAL